MKRLIAVAVAAIAITVVVQSEAQAQSYYGGYQFGAGIRANCGGLGIGGINFQREQPPYFAKFPPVYYSHIVKRPYGVSPYAAPAGIAPVEMGYQQPVITPITKVNPYFRPVEPVADQQADEQPDNDDKVTWRSNPFFNNVQTGIVAK
ncbi:MAG: hypothetical protein AAFN77_11120 [Planctomycetota bacterium]